ncbi:ethanolamine ammonia-lyase reactivating factor EutA [Peribacillus simplex]|uniref:Ethanolamine ammonia-lyase reactivating factor EutA n=1 Tax=Peribacillus simplex TaxID=1478 RepID=A0AAW7I928_9BACI|nr:ethanolamine ammonia-lyase reactivating factor EutA [Peribacillus simplex]MDM5292849.1 ethanolamine ammonia-lyase reactivating factor EutA [Peribacillus simplex]MDM5451774.1 ethanolamine ammonia-lyase reactivating factor EutA [Peribacillus simplex]
MNEQAERIISAGIDIGTSTTKLVISELSLRNVAGGGQVPKIEITDKKILYRSPIFKTPLLSDTVIDIPAVQSMVESEYHQAGITIENIQTGAVIITGETATKQNAEEMVYRLSKAAGEFLVAAAGPDLEGIIAAKGSGAYQHSIETGKTIANIDIGGGTANIAVYRSGMLCGTCTLHIGGRLVEWEGAKVKVAPSIGKWLKSKGHSPLNVDGVIIANEMSKVLSGFLAGSFTKEDELLLVGKEPSWTGRIDVLMFSGGVSDCIYHEERADKSFQDIGMMLATSIKENEVLAAWEWEQPVETVRATVLGAGTHTTEISGATIEVNDSHLPVRNIPVYRIDFQGVLDDGTWTMAQSVQDAITIYDPLKEGLNFAFYLTNLPYLSFRDIQQLAAEFTEALMQKPNQQQPLIIVMDSDYGKVLGQTFLANRPDLPVICIDQTQVEHGDYLDIGRLLRTGVVPVVVKTLTFHN